MLYTLNTHNIVCQLYLNKAGGKDTVRAEISLFPFPHILSKNTFLFREKAVYCMPHIVHINT